MDEKDPLPKCPFGKAGNRRGDVRYDLYMHSGYSLIIVLREILYEIFHGQGFLLLNYCSKGISAGCQGTLPFN